MRIYAASRDDAASYYRLTAPLSVVRYRTSHDVRAGRLRPGLAEGTEAWDVLWLQQHAGGTTEIIVREFLEAGGQVVYDVDDWLFGLPASWPCYDQYFQRSTGNPRERLLFHERLIRLATAVTVPTAYLKQCLVDYLELDEDKVHVLPNCIVQGDWDIIPKATHNLDGPTLGWFGTENHWDDWWEIAPAVDEALEAVGGYMALLGAPEVVTMFPKRLAERTQIYPLVRMRNFDEIRRLIKAFDVGLAWCTDRTEASRCRSPLKAIQYGVAGVPVVASRTVYGELPGLADRYGMVSDLGDLADVLVKAMSTHYEMARQRADAWQGEVWDRHSYERQALRWLDVLEDVKDETGETAPD
jgi:hypothetical protein